MIPEAEITEAYRWRDRTRYKTCIRDGCYEPATRAYLCSAHSRTVADYSTTGGGSDLPNPWHKVSPLCPFAGCPPAEVYQWSPVGLYRWICVTCSKLFTDHRETAEALARGYADAEPEEAA